MNETKMNWLYDYLVFQNYSGKTLLLDDGKHMSTFSVPLHGEYLHPMQSDIIRYAIIDTTEQPLPYNGVVPEVVEVVFEEEHDRYCVSYVVPKIPNQKIEIYIYGKTREEAIRNWNKWVQDEKES